MPIAASIESRAERRLRTGVVLPMTRTVRIEVPPRDAAARRAPSDIERLLRLAAARGATALFLTSDSRPWIRVEGDLRQLDRETPLSRADVESAILEIAPESGHESIGKGEADRVDCGVRDVGRVRCTTFTDHRGPGVLLRMIATRAATAEQLGLAREVQALATEPQGLVLVAGPRGGGKSTLALGARRSGQPPARRIRDHARAADSPGARQQAGARQPARNPRRRRRLGGGGARGAARKSRRAGRRRSRVAAHGAAAADRRIARAVGVRVDYRAVDRPMRSQRFVELAPPEMRKAVQNAMAESFRGAVAQVLSEESRRRLVAAREVLLATAPVTRVIGEGQLGQLPLALESGRKHGMVSFTDALVDFVRAGTVDVREAFRKAPDRDASSRQPQARRRRYERGRETG